MTEIKFNSTTNSVQFSSVQFSSVQFSSVQFSSVQFSSVQFSSVQFRSVQFSSVQFSSVQFSSTFANLSDDSTIQCCNNYILVAVVSVMGTILLLLGDTSSRPIAERHFPKRWCRWTSNEVQSWTFSLPMEHMQMLTKHVTHL